MNKISGEKMDSFFHAIKGAYNPLDRELYVKYNVQRGLRHSDGTGVMAGLTAIGDVKGYFIEDGEKIPCEGRLRYRGIDVRAIVEGCKNDKRFGFEEVIYLLLSGQLPDANELSEFSRLLGEFRDLPDGFAEDMIMRAPSADIMNKLARCVLASYSYDPNPDDVSFANMLRQSIELISRFPTMVAYGYQAKRHYHDGQSLYIQPESRFVHS